MRLITWNVARRVEALAAQAAALGEREPDAIALQEVTARTLPLWQAACATLGLPHMHCTLRAADPAREPAGPSWASPTRFVLHGYAAREPSWTFGRIAAHGGGWRLDHVFASAELEPVACAYHHGWRDDGLSDHSALEADLREPRG